VIISIRRHGNGEPNYYCNENDGSGDEDGCGLMVTLPNVTVMIIYFREVASSANVVRTGSDNYSGGGNSDIDNDSVDRIDVGCCGEMLNMMALIN